MRKTNYLALWESDAMSENMLVKEFMSAPVACVKVDAELPEIVSIMRKRGISSVLVNEGEQPVGMITERDVVSCLASDFNRPLQNVRASALMTSPLITINLNETITAATVLCRSQKIKHLPVVDDTDTLIGIITYSDLINASYLQIDRQTAQLGSLVKGNSVESLNQQLLEMTLTDALMDIGNRRAMEIDLKQTQELAIRYRRPYSIALIDIDHFKHFNDHYGHMRGDECLQQVATFLKKSIREVDRLYRYGGEELLLLLPETPSVVAAGLAERIISDLSAEAIPHEGSQLGHLTASAGVSGYNAGSQNAPGSWQQLLEEADKAMYQAKRQGRNRVCLYGDD